MSINIVSLVANALSTIGVIVCHEKYVTAQNSPAPNSYITFYTYLEQCECYSDDEEEETTFYIQVDYWTKDGRTIYNTATKIKTLMEDKGFRWDYNTDLNETDSYYHRALRFYYTDIN